MRWAGHVEHMGEVRNAYSILFGKPEGRYYLEDLSENMKIILEWI